MGARNIIRLLTEGLISGNKFELQSTDALQILPAVDDQGAVNFGDGTTDMDVKIFLGDTSTYVDFNKGNAQVALAGVDISSNADIVTTANVNAAAVNFTGTMTPSGSAFSAMKVTALATNTVLNATHMGGIITNRGAGGALAHTIPNAAAAYSGAWFQYVGLAGQNQQFTAATVNTLVAFNTATANAVIFNTANELIGASGMFVCDGTSWYAVALQGTMTVIE